jgi:hypothetical protein
MGKWQYLKSLWECVVSNVIITKELMEAIGACDTGPNFIDENNLWGKTEDELIKCVTDAGRISEDPIQWYLKQRTTEAYVRFTGKEFKLGAYQVFNPLTGLHTRYETEAEATAALIEMAKAVLAQHLPTVCQELSNENGDTCWTPIDFSTKYDIVKV